MAVKQLTWGPVAIEQGRAQRWHDTDHGDERGEPLRRTRFIVPVQEQRQWVSDCWCCCELCNPGWNLERPNPFWQRAQAEIKS